MPLSQAGPICLALEPQFFSIPAPLHGFLFFVFFSISVNSWTGKSFLPISQQQLNSALYQSRNQGPGVFLSPFSEADTLLPEGEDIFSWVPGMGEFHNFPWEQRAFTSSLSRKQRTFPWVLCVVRGTAPPPVGQNCVLCETCFQGNECKICNFAPMTTNH